MSKDKRTFVIVNSDGTESGQYTGKTPRQAALKAIKEAQVKHLETGIMILPNERNPATIRIRERGTKKIHVFRGHVSMEQVPEKHPEWMESGAFMKVAHITKVGVEHVDKIGAELVKSGAITPKQLEYVNGLPLPKVN